MSHIDTQKNTQIDIALFVFRYDTGKEQAGAELGQAQLKLELEISFT